MASKEERNSRNDQQLLEDVEKYGFHILFISATDYSPSFGYTVGLYKTYNHPEIILFGSTGHAVQAVMNNNGNLLKSGKQMALNKVYYDFFENVPAQFILVDKRNLKSYFGYDIWYYKNLDFPALQLVWADRNNKFPWDADYDKEFLYRQPLLDRNADFKFRELKNLRVFTTKQYLELGKPILKVVHDKEGDWQFLTGDQMSEDIKIVGLEEMIKKDITLNDVFDLDYGESAERNYVGEEWKRSFEIICGIK